MALTTAQFQAWLENNISIKCTLIEVTATIAGVDTVLYISNRTYNTKSTDTPANKTYLPILKNSLSYTEKLPIDGQANVSYGDISIDNSNGAYDAWMDYVWSNRSINIYIGDPGWPRADFTQIYSGVVSDISFSDRNTINISIRSIIQKLNTTLNSTKVGGTGPAKELIRPMIFGEVHNITPLQTDPSTLTYMVHNGPIERLIEVRDNGVPLSSTSGYIADLTTGTFRLLAAPAGVITCSVQGEQSTVNLSTGAIVSGTWSYSVATIIALIIRKYGNTTINPSDIDLQAFSDFDTLNQHPVGIYISQESNVVSVCQEIAASVGAQFTCTRTGKLTLLKIDVPTTDAASTEINDNYIVRNSLSIVEKIPVQATIKLGYVKNWTVQTQLLTGIPEDHKVMYAKEYYYSYADDSTVRATYMLPAEPEPINTLLISNQFNHVTTESNRRLTLWKQPRYIFKMDCIPKYLTVKLGDMIKLTHYRFGLSSTKSGQVIGTQIDWFTGKVSLEVMV